MDSASPRLARLALLQGGFYAVTGLWPIVHLRSFEAVTGPKLEGWLVKTMGALISVISGTLLFAGSRRWVGPEVRLLSMGSAVAFTAVDVLYVARRRISPVYLLDAAAEVALLAGWAVATSGSRERRGEPRSPARPVHGPLAVIDQRSDALPRESPQR